MEEVRKKKEKALITFCIGLIFAIIGFAMQKGFYQMAVAIKEDVIKNHPADDEGFAGTILMLIGFSIFFLFMIISFIIISIIKFVLALKSETKKEEENNKE